MACSCQKEGDSLLLTRLRCADLLKPEYVPIAVSTTRFGLSDYTYVKRKLVSITRDVLVLLELLA